MDLIHKFLNFVAYPFTLFSFFFILPPLYLFKFFQTTFSFIFKENVSQKVVLITGASSGIGEHLAYEYGKRGALLALAARRKNRLQQVADRARELGSPVVITIHADVSKVDDCRRMVEETVNHFGRLDHLMNNAGFTNVCMFEEIQNIEDFRIVMDTNFWGPVYTTRFALPHLKNSKGKIAVLSSTISLMNPPRMNIYNAAKGALVTFFETLRVEFGNTIGVTIITPGFIESELTQGKFLHKDGKMEVDQDIRDAQLGAVPVEYANKCAKSIVNSVCRGDRYLTTPSWFSVMYLWKAFAPEVIEWGYRFFYVPRSGAPHAQALSKRVLDFTGAKNILYPSTIQSPELKTE